MVLGADGGTAFFFTAALLGMILSFALSTVGSGSPDKPTSVRLGMTNRYGTRISRNDTLNSGTVAYRVDQVADGGDTVKFK